MPNSKKTKAQRAKVELPEYWSAQTSKHQNRSWCTEKYRFKSSRICPFWWKFRIQKTIEKYYHSLGFTDLTTDNFIVTNGGSEALILHFLFIVMTETKIIIPEPYYTKYNGFTNAIGVKVVAFLLLLILVLLYLLLKNLKKLQIKPKQLSGCNRKSLVIFIPEELQKLAEIAFETWYWYYFRRSLQRICLWWRKQVSITKFSEFAEHSIIIDSESKRYSMCGVKIGCLVTR